MKEIFITLLLGITSVYWKGLRDVVSEYPIVFHWAKDKYPFTGDTTKLE